MSMTVYSCPQRNLKLKLISQCRAIWRIEELLAYLYNYIGNGFSAPLFQPRKTTTGTLLLD